MSIKRYDTYPGYEDEVVEHGDGDYVRFDDYDKVRAALAEFLSAAEEDYGIPRAWDGDDEAVGGGLKEDGSPDPMATTFGHLRRARAALGVHEMISIDGRDYRRFIRYPEEITDGTLRCIRCGQIDEEEFHDHDICVSSFGKP